MFFSNIGKWGRTLCAGALICTAMSLTAKAEDRDSKDVKEAKKREVKKEAKESAPGGGGATNRSEERLASSEIEGRRVIMPSDLQMDLDWYSPIVGGEAGAIVRGWVKDDLVLLETAKKYLIAVRREDGTERWRCVLGESIRYEPATSKSNVVINENNTLVGIDRETGDIRWRLMPDFAMSNAPIVIDPAAYPTAYDKDWVNMESLYVGDWKGRMHALFVRGRLHVYSHDYRTDRELSAPEFDIFPAWHYTHNDRGVPTSMAKIVEDYIYYAADDRNVYAVSRDKKIIDPYTLQALPCTPVTVTNNNLYVGCRDFSVYALDRLTLKKKWTYPVGGFTQGTLYADEPDKASFLFIPTENDGVHAIRVVRATNPGEKLKDGEKRDYTPEHWDFGWKHAGDGIVGASPSSVYVGVGKTKDFRGYKQVVAVDKESGQDRWSSSSAGVRFFIEFNNSWRKRDQGLRLYAVTEDNRLLSYRERTSDAGPLVEKKMAESKTPVEGEVMKLGPKKVAAPSPDKPADAPPAADKK